MFDCSCEWPDECYSIQDTKIVEARKKTYLLNAVLGEKI
jgi:hypothetical protein